MQRVEKQQALANARVKLDSKLAELQKRLQVDGGQQILAPTLPTPDPSTTTSNSKGPKVKLNLSTKECLYHTVHTMELWVEAWNDHHKNSKGQNSDEVELTDRKEKTKLLQQIVKMWPKDSAVPLDMPELRRLLGNEKNRQNRIAKAQVKKELKAMSPKSRERMRLTLTILVDGESGTPARNVSQTQVFIN